MAIYHHTTKIVSRSNGRSAVGASAYRSGEKIENERDGITHDYTKKQGVVYTEIQTPDNAPEWVSDRGKLWNKVEKIEKAKNSQLSREVEFALPTELTRTQQIDLVREYVKTSFTDKGMVADIAIHDTGKGNPHCHVMLTMRPFNEDGTWGAKCKKEYILNDKGEKIKLKSGECKSRKIDAVDWNTKERLMESRENWSKCANKHLENHGHDARIDHRSNEQQGIQKAPTIHEGYKVKAMEKRGVETEIGARNKDVENDNKRIELTDKQIHLYEKQLEREIANERGTKDDGTRNENNGADRRTRTGEKSETRGNVNWSAVEHNVQNQSDRVPKQLGNAITRAIQQQVQAVEDRTNRDTGEGRQEDKPTTDKQPTAERSPKTRGHELDR